MVTVTSGTTLTQINVSGFLVEPLGFTLTPATTDPGPLNIYYRRTKMTVIYTAAELNAAGMSGSTTIYGLGFYVVNAPTTSYQPYPNYTIGMVNTTFAVGNDISSAWTTVRTASNLDNFVPSTPGNPEVIRFTTAFTWNGTNNLGIGFAWGMVPTGYTSAGVVRSSSSGSFAYTRTDSAGTYALTDIGATSQSGRPIMFLYVR